MTSYSVYVKIYIVECCNKSGNYKISIEADDEETAIDIARNVILKDGLELKRYSFRVLSWQYAWTGGKLTYTTA